MSKGDDKHTLELIQKIKKGHEAVWINNKQVEGAFIEGVLEKKMYGMVDGKAACGVWAVYLITTRQKYELYQYKSREHCETMLQLIKDLIETVRIEDYQGYQRVQNWLSSGPYFGADSRKTYLDSHK